MFRGWSFKIMSLCGAFPQRCSVVGSPSKLCFSVEHQPRSGQQLVLLQSYVFVWSIRLRVLCRWSSFRVVFLCGALPQGVLQMVLLQSNVFVCSIRPEVFCRLSSFKAMFLCGALYQRCSVDCPSKLCFCVEHYTRGVLQIVLLQSYVFVWSIRPGVLCRWSSFRVVFLCGALPQGVLQMALLQSNVFVWSIRPEVFCRWYPFRVMFLCGALAQGCSVDGPSSKISFCVEHYPRSVLQLVLLQK